MAYPSKPDPRTLARRCDGYGMLTCYCGGDMCVCGLDGSECLGCPDCEGRHDEDDDGYPLGPDDDDEDPRDVAFREPDCAQCGGPARDGFCRVCQ